MDYRDALSKIIEEKRQKLISVRDQIWDYAETGFEEFQSAELLCKTLEEEGFTVKKGVGNIDTAFIGSFGTGKPIIAILGTFDALNRLSKVGGETKYNPVVTNGNIHNLLGTGALAAAIAIRHYLEENNLEGMVRYYGCPGEEIGSEKNIMVREGLFNEVEFLIIAQAINYGPF